jgi:hypothetical protein
MGAGQAEQRSHELSEGINDDRFPLSTIILRYQRRAAT